MNQAIDLRDKYALFAMDCDDEQRTDMWEEWKDCNETHAILLYVVCATDVSNLVVYRCPDI